MKLWMMPLCLMLIALIATSCIKFGGELPDAMDCEITGKLTIWESDKPFTFDPTQPPTVMLMEQLYHTPWTPYLVPLKKVLVNAKGEFKIEHRLKKEKEYFLQAAGYEKPKYMEMAPPQQVKYQKKLVLNVPVVARSWAIPRLINSVGLQGDTLMYFSGFGNGLHIGSLIGPMDTIIPWVYSTWGGSHVELIRHYVSARIIRNGEIIDTNIYYSVPPGDTSVIDIRY